VSQRNITLRALIIILGILLIFWGLNALRVGYLVYRFVRFPALEIYERLSEPAKLFSVSSFLTFHLLGISNFISAPLLVIGGLGLLWLKNWARKILLFVLMLRIVMFLGELLLRWCVRVFFMPFEKISVQEYLLLPTIILLIYLLGFSKFKTHFK